MPNLIYVNEEAAITWEDTTGDEAITLNNLAAGAGRNGALRDYGVAARSRRYAWRAWVRWATAPVVDETVDIYLRTSDGTSPDNDDGTGDVALSSTDKLKNLLYLGSIVVDQAADVLMVASGTVNLDQRHNGPTIFNNSAGDNLQATNNVSGFSLTPIPDEVQ